MPRLVQLRDNHLHVSFSGVMKVATLAGELSIPYNAIEAVQMGCTSEIQGAWKIAGVRGIGSDTQEGHFMGDGHWYFCSFEHVANTITIELSGYTLHGRQYRAVALEVDDPVAFRETLLTKIKR